MLPCNLQLHLYSLFDNLIFSSKELCQIVCKFLLCTSANAIKVRLLSNFLFLARTSIRISLKDVRGWQFLTIEAAETLCMVCLPPEEHIFRKSI